MKETPSDHGEAICFSIYSGPEADFGDGKSCIWVDVLDGGGSALFNEFAPFFQDPAIKKVIFPPTILPQSPQLFHHYGSLDLLHLVSA